MSKLFITVWVVLAILFLHSFQAMAFQNITIELKTNTNLKIVDLSRIEIKDRTIFFNSQPVDIFLLPKLVDSIQVLSYVREDSELSCVAGTYTHSVIKKNKTQSVTGCLNTKRAAQLFVNIKRFQRAIGY